MSRCAARPERFPAQGSCGCGGGPGRAPCVSEALRDHELHEAAPGFGPFRDDGTSPAPAAADVVRTSPAGETVFRQAAAAAAPREHVFDSHGVRVWVRQSCGSAALGFDPPVFAEVERATRAAFDAIFTTECISPRRRARMRRLLPRAGFDVRCRRSSAIGGNCARATGFGRTNETTLGSASFAGHPDSNAGCQPLESTILHELIHLVLGERDEPLPDACESSCFGIARGDPDLCRDDP